MSDTEHAKRLRRRAVVTAALAAGLAIACRFVPPDYRAACDLLVLLCGGSP